MRRLNPSSSLTYAGDCALDVCIDDNRILPVYAASGSVSCPVDLVRLVSRDARERSTGLAFSR